MPNELIRTVNSVKLTFVNKNMKLKQVYIQNLHLHTKFDSQIFITLTEYQISGRENVEELVYIMHHCKE